MFETNYYLLVFVLFCLNPIVITQIRLSSCDYHKYTVNGCEDELGAECDTTANECRCKSGNWFIIDMRFCFPTQCPKDQYYDHNVGRCEQQRKASSSSEENYCRYDFHCRGDHIHCQPVNQWNYRCVCKQGFVYDTTTQECQQIKGIHGFCVKDEDCDDTQLRNLICSNNSCLCAQGFTYNTNIDGCEDNRLIQERDSQTRKFIYLFIGLGLFFGAVLSMKFGTDSSRSAQLHLLRRVINQRQQQREQQRQQRNQEQEQQLDEQIDIESEPIDKTEHLINNREPA